MISVDEINDTISELITNASDIEFPNHNFNASDKEWIKLEEVIDNTQLATNNCFAVASQIEEDTGADLQHKQVLFKDNHSHHFNTYVNEQGRINIVDFTMRQYSDELPCPYHGSAKEWKKLINRYAAKKYGPEAVIEPTTFIKLLDEVYKSEKSKKKQT